MGWSQQKLAKQELCKGSHNSHHRRDPSAWWVPLYWKPFYKLWLLYLYQPTSGFVKISNVHCSYFLGEERGPVLEVIVSRTNFISSHTEKPVRIVGLSTALANARDLADWLNIRQVCGRSINQAFNNGA